LHTPFYTLNSLGTAVQVSIPAPVAEGAATTVDFESMAVDREILVVEDDHDTFDISSVFFKKSGYNIQRAKRPSIALDYCRQRTPDVVLLDLNMPEMDGCALSKVLRSEGYAKPIVMLTASSLRSDRQGALDNGCSDFLVKPVRSTELLRVINMHCDRTSPTEREILKQSYRAALGDHADQFDDSVDELRAAASG
jgi:DNA-binding response OmpR family regulator